MGRFAAFSGQKIEVRGEPFFKEAGEFDCEIVNVKFKQTRKQGAAIDVSLKILESTNPEVRVGETRLYRRLLADQNTAAPALIGFMGAAMGKDARVRADFDFINKEISDNIDPLLEEACEKGSLNGKKIHVSSFPYHTKESNKDIFLQSFSSYKAPAEKAA